MLGWKKEESEEIIVCNRRTSYKKKKKRKNDEIFPKDYLTGSTFTREKDKILSKEEEKGSSYEAT